MKYIAINCVLVLLLFISQINQTQCTCVLDSDFGFSFNCNFKKSGLFRVRNLGGVKAHFGLGFSLGDELGFPESLGNLEGSKRRALNLRTGANSIGVLPAAKMPIAGPPISSISPPIIHKVQQRSPNELNAMSQQQFMQESYPQAMTSSPKQYRSLNMQTPDSRPRPILSTPQGFRKPSQMTLATSLPLGVPVFRPIPHESSKVNKNNIIQMNTIPPPAPQKNYQISNNIGSQSYPPFQALPNSLSRISQGPIYEVDGDYNSLQAQALTHDQQMPIVDLKGHTEEELAVAANVSIEVIRKAIKMRQNQMMEEQKNYAMQLQQQLSYQQTTTAFTTQRPTIRTTTKTTAITSTEAYKPMKKVNNRPLAGGHKVMNAPKEYYPVGYDKNFDDNFVSKVDLPTTSFHCGDQKHFPGLYGDEDLGCMVFHVCALTDDGLIMKSFLCPESTLFDQTILKCNWWFYTDCNKSKTLYDSNLPVSKSYQLMKALSFFSSYKKNSNGTSDATEGSGFDVEALKNSVDASNASLKSLSDNN